MIVITIQCLIAFITIGRCEIWTIEHLILDEADLHVGHGFFGQY